MVEIQEAVEVGMVEVVGVNRGKLYWLFKWFMNDCALGMALIIIGMIMGWGMHVMWHVWINHMAWLR